MFERLTSKEENFLRSILKHRNRNYQAMTLSASLLLVLGVLLIVLAVVYCLRDPVDYAIYLVGLPNFIVGMVLFLVYVSLSKRINEHRTMTSILSKLSRRKRPD